MHWMQLRKLEPLEFGKDKYPKPNRISLETVSACNRRCSFCPISTGRRDFPITLMSENMLNKVIDELEEWGFRGVIQLFLLNEPLLDKRIFRIIEVIRDRLPSASTYISTNADVIDKKEEVLYKLFESGLTVVNLNVYDEGEEQFERYHAISRRAQDAGIEWTDHKYQRHNPRRRYITVTDMRMERPSRAQVDRWYDRKKEDWGNNPVSGYCARPHRHLVILYNGNVPICCSLDPSSVDIPMVGNVGEKTLEELWDSKMMWTYRSHLQEKKRDLPGCKGCGAKMAYSHVVRRVRFADTRRGS